MSADRKMRGVLAGLWGASVEVARQLSAMAAAAPEQRQRARLSSLAAFHRGHSSRLLARCAAMGRGPLPVPDVQEAMPASSVLATLGALAERYARAQEQCTACGDTSSAWVCGLNHAECLDAVLEVRSMLESHQRAGA